MSRTEGAECAYTSFEFEPVSAAPTTATTPGKTVAPHLAYSPLRKPIAAMSGEIREPSRGPPGPFKPALISIPDALYYLGGLSRSKFYENVLPLVDTVKIGKRNFVTTDSL